MESGRRPFWAGYTLSSMSRMVPAVVRAVSILGLLRERTERSIPEIAAALRLPRSTVHELVHTLVELGMLAPTAEGGRFTLGLLLHELGSAYLDQVDLAREGQRVAAAVAERCGETVHLACLDGTEVVYIAKVDSIHTVRMVSAVGRRLPAHCTGVGKALLSGLPETELRRRYGDGMSLPAMTPSSIGTLDALMAELDRVRLAGVAIDDCESNRHVRCVAAPVHDDRGEMVAAMSISVPTIRAGDDWPGELADLVRSGALDLSRRLGHRPAAEASGER